MGEKLCRVTITDIKGGGHVVEVKASSLLKPSQAVKLKAGHIPTDGFRPIKVLVHEPRAEYEVKLRILWRASTVTAARRGT
jgi:hypothetical protein